MLEKIRWTNVWKKKYRRMLVDRTRALGLNGWSVVLSTPTKGVI